MRTQKYTVSCFLEKLMFSLAYHTGGNEAISFKHFNPVYYGRGAWGNHQPFFFVKTILGLMNLAYYPSLSQQVTRIYQGVVVP